MLVLVLLRVGAVNSASRAQGRALCTHVSLMMIEAHSLVPSWHNYLVVEVFDNAQCLQSCAERGHQCLTQDTLEERLKTMSTSLRPRVEGSQLVPERLLARYERHAVGP